MNWNSWAEPSLNKARSNNPVEAGGLGGWRFVAAPLGFDKKEKKKKTDEPWKSAADNEPAQKNCNDNNKKKKKPD